MVSKKTTNKKSKELDLYYKCGVLECEYKTKNKHDLFLHLEKEHGMEI